MNDKQSTEDIRSALWHIAGSLKGIELKLNQVENMAEALYGIESCLEGFCDPFLSNSKFSRLVELIEKQTQIMEDQHHMDKHRR